MVKVITILCSMLCASAVFAGVISPECSARIKNHRTSIQRSAMVTYYYRSLCTVDGKQSEDCAVTDKDLSNTDLIRLAVRNSYSNKPLSEAESKALSQICELKNFDSESIFQIIEDMPE